MNPPRTGSHRPSFPVLLRRAAPSAALFVVAAAITAFGARRAAADVLPGESPVAPPPAAEAKPAPPPATTPAPPPVAPPSLSWREPTAAERDALLAGIRDASPRAYPCVGLVEITMRRGRTSEHDEPHAQVFRILAASETAWEMRHVLDPDSAVGALDGNAWTRISWDDRAVALPTEAGSPSPVTLPERFLNPDALLDVDVEGHRARFGVRTEEGRLREAVFVVNTATGVVEEIQGSLVQRDRDSASSKLLVTQKLTNWIHVEDAAGLERRIRQVRPRTSTPLEDSERIAGFVLPRASK